MRAIPTLGLAIALATAGFYGAAVHAAAPKTEVVEIEKLTWPELKAAMAAGKTTALFYTGGTEQRGPQNIIAGHNAIGRETVRDIALKLGNAIAMPVMPFSPTRVDAETPGDLPLSAETLGLVLEEVSEAAIGNGFKNVILMGDSGGGQGPDGMYAKLAKKLDAKYGPQGKHVYYVDSPYIAARDAYNKIIAEKGYPVGSHGGIQDTSEMMYLETLPGNHDWVRKDQLPNTLGTMMVDGKRVPAAHNGISGDARRSSVELGKLRHEMKVDYAVKQIQDDLASQK